jgi:hypothetical protein
MNPERVCGVVSEALESESRAETMEDLKGFMAASLILALAVIIGLHLAFFWLSSDGQIVIGESNKVLLTIECVIFCQLTELYKKSPPATLPVG